MVNLVQLNLDSMKCINNVFTSENWILSWPLIFVLTLCITPLLNAQVVPKADSFSPKPIETHAIHQAKTVYVFSFQGLFSGSSELHQEISEAIADMRGKIPGMLNLSVGVNKGTKSKYHIGVLILFESKEARDAYDHDPVHQVVVDRYGSYLKERSIVEYEDAWVFKD